MTLVQSDLYWMSAYPMIFFFTGSNAAKSGGTVTILGDEVRHRRPTSSCMWARRGGDDDLDTPDREKLQSR
jgi:hypothetical protein